MQIDASADRITFLLHDDVIREKKKATNTKQDQYEQLIINEIARITRLVDEKVSASGNEFVINLSQLPNSQSFLLLKLSEIAKVTAGQIKTILETKFLPKHAELKRELFILPR